jgi:hypothetical protein
MHIEKLGIIGVGVILATYVLLSGALAADATIEVNGKVNAKITISLTPSGTWDIGTVDPEVSPAPSRVETITINSNKAWTVTAKDDLALYAPVKPDLTKGKMVQYTGSAWLTPTSTLTDTVKIKDGGTTYDLASDVQIASGSKGTSSTDRTLSQTTKYTDDPTVNPNYYKIIVTFVAAQGS